MPKGISIKYTAEMESFLHKHKEMLRKEMTKLFNAKFGTNISRRVLNAKCERIGALTGRNGQFAPGQKSWNKGKTGYMGANKTSFQKGHTPHNHKPVGFERVTKDGYIEIKTAEPNMFELKHRVIWVKANGVIPKGHTIVFKNQNKTDCRIENLELLTRAELARLNQSYSKLATPETNETCILMAKIKDKTHKLKVA